MPAGAPTHHFAWLIVKGETHEITRIRRNVLERQPHTFATLRQEIEAEDTGEASAELASLSVALRTMRSALVG